MEKPVNLGGNEEIIKMDDLFGCLKPEHILMLRDNPLDFFYFIKNHDSIISPSDEKRIYHILNNKKSITSLNNDHLAVVLLWFFTLNYNSKIIIFDNKKLFDIITKFLSGHIIGNFTNTKKDTISFNDNPCWLIAYRKSNLIENTMGYFGDPLIIVTDKRERYDQQTFDMISCNSPTKLIIKK